MNPRPSHKANAPGDFYVEEGCCLTCAVPHTVAPDLFAWSDAEHTQCIVCKQPGNSEELDRMVAAFEVSDLECIRYKGTDRMIQIRLVRIGEGQQCDRLLPDLQLPVRRFSTDADSPPQQPYFGHSPFESLLLKFKRWIRRDA